MPGIVTENVHVARVGGEQRLTRGGDVARDAFADLRDQLIQVFFGVLGRELAAERDRHQAGLVLQEVHAAVVVIDDRPQLRGDRVADLGRLGQHVQLRGEAVEHVELRVGPVGVALARAGSGVLTIVRPSPCACSHLM